MFCAIHENVVFLSYQVGVKVVNCDNEVILKASSRVHLSEGAGMRLVKEHTDIPAPENIFATYFW